MNFNERYVSEEFVIMFDELKVEFSEDEILKSIKQLKTNKSCSQDRIINEFSFVEITLLPILLSIFNKTFVTGTFLNDWSEVYIISFTQTREQVRS